MDNKGLILGMFAIGAGLWFLNKRLKEKDEREQEEERAENEAVNEVLNNYSEDINTQAAVNLKELMNVNDNFNFWTVDKVTTTARVCRLYNIMLSITDFAKVQGYFQQLCKNEKNLTACLQEACTNEVFKKALELATAKKVITTAAATLILTDKETMYNMRTVNIEANTNVGALISRNEMNTDFINGYKEHGAVFTDIEEVTGYVPTAFIKII